MWRRRKERESIAMKKLILALILMLPSPLYALESDKTAHLITSFVISYTIFGIHRAEGESRMDSAANAIFWTLMVGTAKELYDNTQPGNKMDMEDMKWNAIGAISAPILFWSF